MIQSVHNYAVAALLDVEGSLAYAVPRYQREYAWNKHQWDKLFEDIQEVGCKIRLDIGFLAWQPGGGE